MKIERISISGINESIKASKYPMAINVDELSNAITPTVKSLAQSDKGEGHDQFLTGINVAFDLTCSNKMWVEMERYRFVYFVSSQSTMHRAAKFDLKSQCNSYVDDKVINRLVELQKQYKEEPSPENYLKLLYNIPSGFELTARLTTNYRELKTIYSQRHNHRLPEWREFCKWIETLPSANDLIIGEKKNDKEVQM